MLRSTTLSGAARSPPQSCLRVRTRGCRPCWPRPASPPPRCSGGRTWIRSATARLLPPPPESGRCSASSVSKNRIGNGSPAWPRTPTPVSSGTRRRPSGWAASWTAPPTATCPTGRAPLGTQANHAPPHALATRTLACRAAGSVSAGAHTAAGTTTAACPRIGAGTRVRVKMASRRLAGAAADGATPSTRKPGAALQQCRLGPGRARDQVQCTVRRVASRRRGSA
mmetsp:Transcript_35212/g.113430  ORF Transcript_35212/g.113430 Transcript_35212/m.113430 type:complete len:225 (-) Transcript_35212:31-705(-)